jgi:hypothetical protein
MRRSTYSLFEIVAWPAAVWCAIELALRAGTTTFDGAGMTAVTGALAAMTIVACRWRGRQLATQPAP